MFYMFLWKADGGPGKEGVLDRLRETDANQDFSQVLLRVWQETCLILLTWMFLKAKFHNLKGTEITRA